LILLRFKQLWVVQHALIDALDFVEHHYDQIFHQI